MTVYKRGSKGVFYMEFVVKGERINKSTGKYTRKEALIVEAIEKKRMLEDSSLSPRERASRRKLSEAIQKVYDERWKYNKASRRAEQRGSKLLGYMGDIPIGKIDDDEVAKLIKNLEARKITPATINRYLAFLKTLLRHNKQPWDHIHLKKERKGRIRVVTREEENRAVGLLKAAPAGRHRYNYPQIADVVQVLVDTGLRLSEALNLRYEDVDFDNNLLTIWINKGDKPRSIPMTVRCNEILKKRQTANADKPFSIDKHQADRGWKWVRATMGLEHDKEFVLHALRHTCASRLVNKGIDLYVVKEWLGHSSIQVTEKYAHLAPQKLAHAVKVLEVDELVVE